VIEVQHLTKRYGPFTAVDDISFSVNKGEILGFLGPNGAGKTTTMRVLTGYMPPTEGTAVVAGYSLLDKPIEAKRRTGYLPETPPLYPDMTVREYLEFCARIKGLPRGDRKARVTTAMERTRVADMANRHCAKLSKGYRQRVGLAQALLGNPEVLILDEPTAGLDPKQIIETRELIRGLGGDHTVVLSTHILPEVSMTCGRVVIISRGRVVAEDTPDNLTQRLKGGAALRLEVRGEREAVLGTVRAVPGVLSAQELPGTGPVVEVSVETQPGGDVRADLARAVVGGGFDLLEMQRMGMSLEDIFLHLTTTEPAGEHAPPPPVAAGEVVA